MRGPPRAVGPPGLNRPRHAAQRSPARLHAPLGGVPQWGVVAMGRDSSKQSWNKCSDRSQHEYKDQPSFELFQFKSIRFFHDGETCSRLKISFKLVEERCVDLASKLG